MKIICFVILFVLQGVLYGENFTLEEYRTSIYLTEQVLDNKCKVLKLYRNSTAILSTSHTKCKENGDILEEELEKFYTAKKKIFDKYAGNYNKTPVKKYKMLDLPFTAYHDIKTKKGEMTVNIETKISPFSDEVFFFLTVNGEKVKLLMRASYDKKTKKSIDYKAFYITGHHYTDKDYYLFIRYKDILYSKMFDTDDTYKGFKPYTFNFHVQRNLMWLIDSSYKFNDRYKKYTEDEKFFHLKFDFLQKMAQKRELDSQEAEELKYLEWRFKTKPKYFIESINQANDLYKYKDWRLPTKKELMSLDKKKSFTFFRTRAYYTKSSIDRDIFGDQYNEDKRGNKKYFLSSDTCNKDKDNPKFYAVYYGQYRQKVYVCQGTHTCNRKNLDNEYGAKVGCISYSDKRASIRLVRDVK